MNKETGKKETTLHFRVSEEQFEKLLETAKDYGMPRSEFARCALEYVLKNKPVLGKSFAPGSVSA